MVAKEFLPLSNGCSKGVQPCPQKRKSLLVKFKTLEMANKRYLGRSEIPQGLDVLVQGQAAGQVVPVSCHHIHQAPWQQGGHILGDGTVGHPGLGGSQRPPGLSGRVKNGQMGSGHEGPGRNGTGVMTGEGSQSGENRHWVYEE